MTVPASSSSIAPAALRARTLGILGGSFDPPHLGHLFVARTARLVCRLEHVLFVPAARPPHKPERVLASAADRVAMLELLLADEPLLSVWTTELEREGPSYTIDTVKELRAAVAPGTELFLLIGSDNLPGLPGWRDAEELLSLVVPVVVWRRGSRLDPDELARVPRELRQRFRVIECAPFDCTASDLRRRLAAGDDLDGLLPSSLAEYARARGLYSPAE